jgi:hypothetical protein
MGCKQLESATYSDGRLLAELSAWCVPVKSDTSGIGVLAKRFAVDWTPSILFLDPQERVHHRFVGFLPADDFMAHLHFARARIWQAQGLHDQAFTKYRMVTDRYQKSPLAPEAMYWSAVCKYKQTNKREDLVSGWKRLAMQYPNSEWGRRVLWVS